MTQVLSGVSELCVLVVPCCCKEWLYLSGCLSVAEPPSPTQNFPSFCCGWSKARHNATSVSAACFVIFSSKRGFFQRGIAHWCYVWLWEKRDVLTLAATHWSPKTNLLWSIYSVELQFRIAKKQKNNPDCVAEFILLVLLLYVQVFFSFSRRSVLQSVSNLFFCSFFILLFCFITNANYFSAYFTKYVHFYSEIVVGWTVLVGRSWSRFFSQSGSRMWFSQWWCICWNPGCSGRSLSPVPVSLACLRRQIESATKNIQCTGVSTRLHSWSSHPTQCWWLPPIREQSLLLAAPFTCRTFSCSQVFLLEFWPQTKVAHTDTYTYVVHLSSEILWRVRVIIVRYPRVLLIQFHCNNRHKNEFVYHKRREHAKTLCRFVTGKLPGENT